MLAFRRGLRLVSWRTAFGDASETDAQNQTRADFYALRLGKFNAQQCKISGFRRLIKLNINNKIIK